MPFITKSSSSSTTSTCSTSSTDSTSSLRVLLNQMLDSILHPFNPPQPPQASPSRSKDLLNEQYDMNANLSLFEKTYVSFPELVDQDGATVRHTTTTAATTTTATQPLPSFIAY